MKFLYETAIGRMLLNLMLHAKVLKCMEWFVKTPLSKWMATSYIQKHQIDMTPFRGQKYNSFAEFFVRKKEVDFDSNPNALISPCDGLLSLYSIQDDSTFKIKGIEYSLFDLVKNKKLAAAYKDGVCAVFRLQASDYHHYCYIDDCYHKEGKFIPGKLHSVQPIAIKNEPVFRINRRNFSILKTVHFGYVTQIEVGAVLVGGIVHEKKNAVAKRGEEMGRFELCGSTIILLFQKEVMDHVAWNESLAEIFDTEAEIPVKIGKTIGFIK